MKPGVNPYNAGKTAWYIYSCDPGEYSKFDVFLKLTKGYMKPGDTFHHDEFGDGRIVKVATRVRFHRTYVDLIVDFPSVGEKEITM